MLAQYSSLHNTWCPAVVVPSALVVPSTLVVPSALVFATVGIWHSLRFGIAILWSYLADCFFFELFFASELQVLFVLVGLLWWYSDVIYWLSSLLVIAVINVVFVLVSELLFFFPYWKLHNILFFFTVILNKTC